MTGLNEEPIDTSCSNPGRDDYWTCPGCYHDLGDVGEGRHTCPECGRGIDCAIDIQPVCVARLADHEEEAA
ncbi:hypothetical protein BV509_00865 [Rhodovulum sulfidophilum]|uniref:Rubrerythrin-like domain-containing protein n=1 Tax=Rhodovulum visakhapatnamense TaxID=364297 RepID=A0ABS1RFW2_9RHOB|nr:hypothetical protein [Rhodovulum visakhapatnamense]MBL3569887.1 hypothetical protein [Rhodovulum visakhapatnamense]MBL3578420.1 hypothetical protein [Rhodovulum visakhapatnamense]OLS43040.1 hypothetical protein BV509_00865 [Rhodovulum sulfidophilum]